MACVCEALSPDGQMGEVLHRVVIAGQQHIAVVRHHRAVAEIADDDARIVDAEQLVEVRVARVVENDEVPRGGTRHGRQRGDHGRSDEALDGFQKSSD